MHNKLLKELLVCLLQAKAEHDAYLAQIETEGQAEAMYGKGVQLIIPEPGLVVKTKDAHGKIRVYINICTSNKVYRACQQRDLMHNSSLEGKKHLGTCHQHCLLHASAAMPAAVA